MCLNREIKICVQKSNYYYTLLVFFSLFFLVKALNYIKPFWGRLWARLTWYKGQWLYTCSKRTHQPRDSITNSMEWFKWQLNDSHSFFLFPDTSDSLSKVFYFLLSTCTKSIQLEVHLNEQIHFSKWKRR